MACLFAAIKLIQEKQKVLTIRFSEAISTEDLTLLERIYDDVDSDGKNESIELFTSAKKGPDELIEWDDGQRWLLLVKDGGKKFPLFDDYVQLGQLQFWVGIINKSETVSTSDVDLERHIYVMISGNSIQLSDYYWDKQNLSFKKEIIFNPPNQWDVKSSYKYFTFNPALIEPEKSTPN
jgi:hypothetical protein